MQEHVREALPNDAEQMIAHIQRLAEEPDIDVPLAPGEFDLTVEEEREILTAYAASENSIFLVTQAGEDIVGLLNCRGGKRKATRHAATLGLSIRKAWRNRGVGSALMEQAIEWARATGIVKRIELAVYARNQAAIHLYEKFGFEVEGRRQRAVCQNGEYLDDLIMALLLQTAQSPTTCIQRTGAQRRSLTTAIRSYPFVLIALLC